MTVVLSEPRVFRQTSAPLAEGPFWDPEGELVWVDISSRRVIRSPLDGAAGGSDDRIFETPSEVGFALPAIGGDLVLGLVDGVYLSGADGADLRPLAPIEHAEQGMRLNDARVDPQGRLLAGSIEQSTRSAAAVLYSIDLSGAVRELRRGFGNANGVDWSPDGSLIYFTDTRQDTIYVADYAEDGVLRGERPFHTGAHHDGLTVDSEGYVWGAVYGAGEVLRMAPDGSVVERIAVPTPNTTSVALGGANMSTLFITTAAQGTQGDPLAGAVFAVDVSVPGLPVRVFGTVTPLGVSG